MWPFNTWRVRFLENMRKGENACFQHFLLFSSPEHNVLRLSYCDWSMSVVCLSVRKQLLKNLLLWWYSLIHLSLKQNAPDNFQKQYGKRENCSKQQCLLFLQDVKHLTLNQTMWPFNTWRVRFLENMRKGENACFQHFLLFSSPEHNMLRLSYCDWSLSVVCLSVRKQLLKNLLLWNRQWNFTEMILRWCTFKILQRFQFHEELWLP